MAGSRFDPRFDDLGVDSGCDQIPPVRLAFAPVVHHTVVQGVVQQPKVQRLSRLFGMEDEVFTNFFTNIGMQSELATFGDLQHQRFLLSFGGAELSGIQSSCQCFEGSDFAKGEVGEDDNSSAERK